MGEAIDTLGEKKKAAGTTLRCLVNGRRGM
jgi:hypothetical protein